MSMQYPPKRSSTVRTLVDNPVYFTDVHITSQMIYHTQINVQKQEY
jgi:hypothetical protein